GPFGGTLVPQNVKNRCYVYKQKAMKKGLIRLPSVTATLRKMVMGDSIRLDFQSVSPQGLYQAKKRLNAQTGKEEWKSRVVTDERGRKFYEVTRKVVSGDTK
uniref:hypothetical protein n=2 Tax=Alloprevotella sp. TaxID=1872471 RepID=UPI00402725E6